MLRFVSRETIQRLELFVEFLLKWNGTVNLISKADENMIWDRHILNSLRLLPLLPLHTTRAIDLGSGGGFPGLVLSLASDTQFDLVEADHRKASFLREAVRVTDAKARVVVSRIETTQLQVAKVITARALAPLDRLLSLAQPLLAPGGVCLFLKGRRAEIEIKSAEIHWLMSIKRYAEADGSLALRISDLARREAVPERT